MCDERLKPIVGAFTLGFARDVARGHSGLAPFLTMSIRVLASESRGSRGSDRAIGGGVEVLGRSLRA